MQHRRKATFAAASLALYGLPSFAQSNASLINVLPGNDTQRAQQQRLEANATNGSLGNALNEDAPRATSVDLAHLPVQSPCFEIEKSGLRTIRSIRSTVSSSRSRVSVSARTV
ncbi:hypothetical protein [Paraburkholderia caledonica]|uniref:hypothetical protein n=1 Tax=Paraburkholderia caledonica TaxID=134536 RepID=UPI00211B3095|nr:hypothetical protein [Paraburkholderia caledonica]